MRKYTCILLVFLTLFACVMTGSAVASDSKRAFGQELEIPADFSFSTQDQCSGHSYFHHAVAQEDGRVAVFSHHIDSKENNSETFKRQYIDIYDCNGELEKELSFYTEQAYAPAFENGKLYLYFYSYVIVLDPKTNALRCYDIDDVYVADRGDVSYQQPKTFKAGEWEYKCVKGFSGYKKLIRRNDATEQVVVDMSNGMFPVGACVGSVLCAVIIVSGGIMIRKRKKNGHRTENY